jgi:hypothetical protein
MMSILSGMAPDPLHGVCSVIHAAAKSRRLFLLHYFPGFLGLSFNRPWPASRLARLFINLSCSSSAKRGEIVY